MKREHDTRLVLLETAVELIWEHSYGFVSVDDICKRAGVLKGSFYHFFESKSDLAVAAYEHYWNVKRRPRLDEVFSPQHPPLDRLMQYCDQVYDMQRERFSKTGKVVGCPFSTIGSELSTQDEKVRMKCKEVADRNCVYFVSALRDGMRDGTFGKSDPEVRARELYSLVTGILLQARISGDLEMIKNLKPTMRRLLDLNVRLAA